VKARHILEQSAFGPEDLAIITTAFEDAWRELGADYLGEEARASARMRLAVIVLDLAKDGIPDARHLTALATQAMGKPLN
jgi:hypothetical protein